MGRAASPFDTSASPARPAGASLAADIPITSGHAIAVASALNQAALPRRSGYQRSWPVPWAAAAARLSGISSVAPRPRYSGPQA